MSTLARLVLVAVTAVCIPHLPVVAQTPTGEEAAIRKLVAEYAETVNRGNADAYGALHAADAFIVEPDGRTRRGRAAIVKGFRDDLAGPAKGVQMPKHQVVAFRLVTPTSGVGLSTWEQTIPNQPAIRGAAFFAVSKVGGTWILDGWGAVPEPAK